MLMAAAAFFFFGGGGCCYKSIDFQRIYIPIEVDISCIWDTIVKWWRGE